MKNATTNTHPAKLRTAADFARIVKREIKSAPEEPVRLDGDLAEWDEAGKAWDLLVMSNGPRGKLVPWEVRRMKNGTPELREQGKCRFAFFGPAYKHLKPVEIIRVSKSVPESERKLELQRLVEQTRRKKGRGYHVAGKIVTRGGEKVHVVMVWRGDDWLKDRLAALWPAEIPHALLVNTVEADYFEPLAKKETARHDRRMEISTGPKAHRPPKRDQAGKVLTDHLPRYVELKKITGSARQAALQLQQETKATWTDTWIYKTLEPMTRRK